MQIANIEVTVIYIQIYIQIYIYKFWKYFHRFYAILEYNKILEYKNLYISNKVLSYIKQADIVIIKIPIRLYRNYSQITDTLIFLLILFILYLILVKMLWTIYRRLYQCILYIKLISFIKYTLLIIAYNLLIVCFFTLFT